MDHLSKKMRSWNMSRIRSKHTKPEQIVYKIFRRLGVKYNLHQVHLAGKPDIIIKDGKKAIFVNGCFWHQHKGCKRRTMPKTNLLYWQNKLKRNIQKQIEDIKKLRKTGWKTFIVWECETKNLQKLSKKLSKIPA